MASRHLSRIAALQALFAADIREKLSFDLLKEVWERNIDSLAHGDEDKPFTEKILKGIAAKYAEIDAVIEKAAPQWPLHKIAAIDRNILRIGLYELLYGESLAVPPKVALNESIELAKTFGGDASSKFVNGVLGSVYREMGSPRKEEAAAIEEKAQAHSAGVVVCAKEGDAWFVALVLDPFEKWTIPKSKRKEGELSMDTAVRAVHEELGLESLELEHALGEHEYEAHDPKEGKVKRTVGYFVGCAKKVPLASGKETVQEVRWCSETEIEQLPIYEDLRSIIGSGIEKAQKMCTQD